jgi:transcriptional regulator with XRE-family HTH domain
MNQPQIGQFISELRLLTGLTQEQFAAKLGFTWGTVNRSTRKNAARYGRSRFRIAR